MTHEELLKIIDDEEANLYVTGGQAGNMGYALRSVINLHSPEGKPDQQCRNCKRFYPCHTIQAIIKELG